MAETKSRGDYFDGVVGTVVEPTEEENAETYIFRIIPFC
jgi:hypothetical protein